MTDVEGVRDGDGSLISALDAARARELLGTGAIRDGMIPKVEAAIRATDGGCATHIIDARVPHALLLELLTERGVGTMLTQGEAQ
jgi:acetylglutamate kinase